MVFFTMNEIDAMNGDFDDPAYFLNAFQPASQGKVYNALQAFGFPQPSSRQYYNGDAPIVFCNPFGFAMRFNLASRFPLLRHPHLIRPLGAIDLGQYRLEIQPMLPLLDRSELSQKLSRHLEDDGILAQDIKNNPSNSLVLPLATQNFPRGYPVIFDPLSLKCLNATIREFSTVLPRNIIDLRPADGEERDIQDQAYDDLREKFAATATDANTFKDNFYVFLDACIKAKSEGRLTDLASLTHSNRMPSHAALTYEQELWRHCDYFKSRTVPAAFQHEPI